MHILLTFGYNSSIIDIEKELRNMRKKEICKLIDRLVDNAIHKYGMEDKKTIIISENAENIKEKFLDNLIKIY